MRISDWSSDVCSSDLHLSTISKDEAGGFSEHTWNLVAEGSDDQMLVLEVSEKMFEHFTLERGAFIYMNTMNLHMISRKSPNNVVVIVQVEGFDRTQRDEAKIGRASCRERVCQYV